jgi:topoisomerase IA-like protein
MENIKPYLGKIEDSPVFLNNGKFGWYLNYNDKLYSVPEAFQSKKFDLKTAQKIIDWKDAHPTPSKIPTIAQLDSYEKAKKAKKQSDDESESSEEEVKKVLKVKKQIK